MQDVYNYAYMFSREKGQKCVQLDMAIGMWQLLFTQRPWPLLDAWCSFLQTHHKHAISKDTWTQLLDFIKVQFACLLVVLELQALCEAVYCLLHILL